MANLRIVYSNAADRSTLTASTTAGTLVAANLLTDRKSEVWRSTGNTATLTMTWTTAETVSAVALPFCSLSSTATIRVRGYTNTGDASPVVDSGTILACPGSYGSTYWNGLPSGVNAYAYGGAACSDVYITPTSVKKIVVDIADTANSLGYIEAARLVVGAYWSPVNNVEYGVKLSVEEGSKHERSDAGDLHTDRGCVYKTLSFDLSLMPTTDRDVLWKVLRLNGMSKALYVQLTPESSDASEEQMFQIYGKLSRQSSIAYTFLNQFATQLQIEEV